MEAQITSLTNSINSNGATGDGNFSSSNHDALQKSIDAAKHSLKLLVILLTMTIIRPTVMLLTVVTASDAYRLLLIRLRGHMIRRVPRKTLKQLQQKKQLKQRELLITKQIIHIGLAEVVIQMMLQIKWLHGILKENHTQLLPQHGKTRKIKHIFTSMYLTMKRKQLK